MPTQSPYRIEPTDDQRAILDERARAHTAPYWEVVRARIVLLAAEGFPNKQIAKRLYTTPQTVSKWRKRFHQEGLGGLEICGTSESSTLTATICASPPGRRRLESSPADSL